MSVQDSTWIVSECISHILESFYNKLLQKRLEIVARKHTANNTAELSRQFATLVGRNYMNSQINPQLQEPPRIQRDSFSSYHTPILQNSNQEKAQIHTQKSTKDRSSSNYTKLTYSVKETNKLNKKQFIALEEEKPPLVPNPIEDRLRHIYLIKLKNKLRDEKEMEQSQAKGKKTRQFSHDLIKNRQFFAYGYDAKLLKGKGKSIPVSNTVQVKPEVNKSLNFIKKIKQIRPSEETINKSLIESAYFKSRRQSIQVKPAKLFEDLSVRNTPVFCVNESPGKDGLSQLKLPQFKSLCRKNKAKQYRFFTEKRESIQLPQINRTTGVRESFKTEMFASSPFGRSRNKRSQRYYSRDSIKINPELYEFYMNSQ